MRYVRCSSSLAIPLAVLAFSAPAALAEPVHCPAVSLTGHEVSGGCPIHVSGADVEYRGHLLGGEFLITKCNWEFDLRLDEDGSGYVHEQTMSNGSSGSCTRQPCAEASGAVIPWPATATESGSEENLRLNLCFEPLGGGTDNPCELDIPFRATGTDQYEFGTKVGGVPQEIPGHPVAGGAMRCELAGHWNSELANIEDMAVEVGHLEDDALELTYEPPTPLEVTNEATGVHCPAVTLTGSDVNGGCLSHAGTGNDAVELRKHVFGVESHITSCRGEFYLRINEDAAGYALEQQLVNPVGGTCSRQPCKGIISGEQTPWSTSGTEIAPSTALFNTTICLEPSGGGIDETCNVDFPLQVGLDHDLELGGDGEAPSHGTAGFRCELVGHWQFEHSGFHDGEFEQPIEVLHVP